MRVFQARARVCTPRPRSHSRFLLHADFYSPEPSSDCVVDFRTTNVTLKRYRDANVFASPPTFLPFDHDDSFRVTQRHLMRRHLFSRWYCRCRNYVQKISPRYYSRKGTICSCARLYIRHIFKSIIILTPLTGVRKLSKLRHHLAIPCKNVHCNLL